MNMKCEICDMRRGDFDCLTIFGNRARLCIMCRDSCSVKVIRPAMSVYEGEGINMKEWDFKEDS